MIPGLATQRAPNFKHYIEQFKSAYDDVLINAIIKGRIYNKYKS